MHWLGRVLLTVVLALPAGALARSNEPEREPVDARLEGYPTNVTLDSRSSGMTWVLLIIFGGMVFGGLFKDAKRSHLD